MKFMSNHCIENCLSVPSTFFTYIPKSSYSSNINKKSHNKSLHIKDASYNKPTNKPSLHRLYNCEINTKPYALSRSPDYPSKNNSSNDTPFQHQTNGLTERVNSVTKPYLSRHNSKSTNRIKLSSSLTNHDLNPRHSQKISINTDVPCAGEFTKDLAKSANTLKENLQQAIKNQREFSDKHRTNPPDSYFEDHPRRKQPPPPPIIKNDEEYEVEKILDKRKHYGKIQYLIKWKGYPLSEASWEPENNLNCPDLLEEFNKNN